LPETKGVEDMKAIRIAAVALVLLVPTLVPGLAHAGGGSSVVCTISVPVHFSPGLTMTPGSGVKGSGGETGTILCKGSIDGHNVTGQGGFGFDGTYTDSSCTSGKGDLTFYGTVPTTDGPVHFKGAVTQSWVGLAFKMQGTLSGTPMKATAVAFPTHGDCLTTPVTAAVASVTAMTV
jgi:hypothetical protein